MFDQLELSEDLGVLISRQGLQERSQGAVPFMQTMFGLLALIPALAILGLLWFVWRLDRISLSFVGE